MKGIQTAKMGVTVKLSMRLYINNQLLCTDYYLFIKY